MSKNVYDEVKKGIEDQGKEFSKQVFLDMSDERVLKRLKLYEDCHGIIDVCKTKIKNIFINAHGTLIFDKEKFTIPDNVVLLFMGKMGNLTIQGLMEMEDFCNKKYAPNQIFLPGTELTDVLLGSEESSFRGEVDMTGIYDCELVNKGSKYPVKNLENYLRPSKKLVQNKEFSEFFSEKSNFEKYKFDINNNNNKQSIFLSEVVNIISKNLEKDHYAFIYTNACLGGICKWSTTTDDIEIIKKLSDQTSQSKPLKGYTIKKIPKRYKTLAENPFTKIHGIDFLIRPLKTKDIYLAQKRKKIVEYIKTDNIVGLACNMYAFLRKYPNENLFDHVLNDLSNLESISLTSVGTKFYLGHGKFINAIIKNDTYELQKIWFEHLNTTTFFLFPKNVYIEYAAKIKKNKVIKLLSSLEERKDMKHPSITYEINIDDIDNVDKYNYIIGIYKKFYNKQEVYYNFLKKHSNIINNIEKIFLTWTEKNFLIDYSYIEEKIKTEKDDFSEETYDFLENMLPYYETMDELIKNGYDFYEKYEKDIKSFIDDFKQNVNHEQLVEDKYMEIIKKKEFKRYYNKENEKYKEYSIENEKYKKKSINMLKDIFKYSKTNSPQSGGGIWQQGGFFMVCY